MRESVHLVLLDFKLSETDGGIVAFEMRRRRPEVRIAFLADDPGAPMPKNSVDRVLPKRLKPRELLNEVRMMIEGAHANSPSGPDSGVIA